MRYQDLNKEIRQGIFHPVYLFTGPETYVAAYIEKNLIKAAVPEALAQLNVMSFSDKETDIASVTAICRQLPVMSEHRVVVLREETGIAHSSDTVTVDALCAYLEAPEPDTILIVYDARPDKRKKIYKALAAAGTVVEFVKQSRQELEKWIARRLDLAGKSTSRAVVERFIDDSMYLTSENKTMEGIDNELGKLIDFAGQRQKITMSDLEATLPRSIDENIFRMADHAMQGQTAEALLMLENFYLEGESPFGVFGLLVSQLRTMLMIRCYTEAGRSQAETGKIVRRPPFVVQKIQNTARAFSTPALRGILVATAELDLQMKTGVVEPEMGVELFILKLSEVYRTPRGGKK
jgi:DNA polymerase-3 subunit delta